MMLVTNMQNQLFRQFVPTIRSLSAAELDGADSLIARLFIAKEGNVEVCYAPFEYINPQARLVIVGITPGRTQMINALKEARWQLDSGADEARTLIAAKQTGAFSGSMRPSLVSLLDSIGLNRWLGISSSDMLFGSAKHLVQTTSVLRNPVFINGDNYNGTPNMIRHPLFRNQLLTHFGPGGHPNSPTCGHPKLPHLSMPIDADWKLTSFCSLCLPIGDHPRFSTDTGQCETGAGGQSGIGENTP